MRAAAEKAIAEGQSVEDYWNATIHGQSTISDLGRARKVCREIESLRQNAF